MELDELHTNTKWVTHQFLTQLDNALKISLDHIDQYFHLMTVFTLSLYRGDQFETHETIGGQSFKSKLYALNITKMHLHQYQVNSQMLHQSHIVLLHGLMMINQGIYPFIATIIFKWHNFQLIIDHWLLNIFLPSDVN